MRIAIVDDIASERENLHGKLYIQLSRINLDAEISEFGFGTDFLAAAGKERFDLAFLDIYMGSENGVDTARALRRFDADCLLPGMLMAYLPMKQYLRMRPARLAAFTVPLTLFLCLAGGALHCFFNLSGFWMFVPVVAIAGVFYVHTLNITRWKSVSVFLAVCGTFSCMPGAAVALSDIISPGKPAMTCAIILTSCPGSPGRRNGKTL